MSRDAWIATIVLALVATAALALAVLTKPHRPLTEPGRIEVTCYNAEEAVVRCP